MDPREPLERYELSWPGKSRARRLAEEPAVGALAPVPEESVDWERTPNVFVEGDNLAVLKLLRPTLEGRVQLIYLDPPYNTGNAFVYSDRFEDRTAWLNLMYPRLILARPLLRPDGALFVSIDDNEVHNLRHLLDEVFGPENFVADLIWQSRTSISNDRPFSSNHTHTLVYARDAAVVRLSGEALDASDYDNPDDDPRGPYKLVPIDANKPGGDTRYPITNPATGRVYYPPNNRSWAINPQTFAALLADGRIRFGKAGDSAPKRKLFLREREGKGDTKTPSTLLLDAGTTKDGTTELMALFDGKKVFDYPKPTSLLRRVIQYACPTGEPAIVLDFFAGSGTTGHAAMVDDRHDVRFVCVQAPEPVGEETLHGRTATSFGLRTIADIAKERLRRVSASPAARRPGFRAYRWVAP